MGAVLAAASGSDYMGRKSKQQQVQTCREQTLRSRMHFWVVVSSFQCHRHDSAPTELHLPSCEGRGGGFALKAFRRSARLFAEADSSWQTRRFSAALLLSLQAELIPHQVQHVTSKSRVLHVIRTDLYLYSSYAAGL